jgi:predicted small metal-binding protein
VTGETEEDVVRSAVEHDIKEHGKTKKDMVKMREKLKGFIYTLYY